MCNTSYGYNNYLLCIHRIVVRNECSRRRRTVKYTVIYVPTPCIHANDVCLCRAMGKHVMFAWIFHTCNIIHYGVFFFSTIARAWKSFPRPHGACGRGKKQVGMDRRIMARTLHVYVGTIMYRKQNEGKWTLTKTFRKSFAECLSKPRVVSVGNWKGNTKVDDRRGSRDCCGDEKNENMCFACGIRIVIVISRRYTYCTL